MQQIKSLYRQTYGCYPERVIKLTADGSSRQYFRLIGNPTVIATIGSNIKENKAFVALSRHFRSLDLPVPEVLAVDNECRCYLQSDCGNQSLYDVMMMLDVSAQAKLDVLSQSIDVLVRFNYMGARGFDAEVCYPRGLMDEQSIMWDLNYFKYCFLKLLLIEFDEEILERDFRALASDLGGRKNDTIMLRDFQSRNIMIGPDGKINIIDFQGARWGSGVYDLVSLLWQSRLNLSDDIRRQMVDMYLTRVHKLTGRESDSLRRDIPLFRLLRLLQVLGAYGFRGFIQHKSKFLSPIYKSIAQLADLIVESDFARYPYLISILKKITLLPEFGVKEAGSSLTVKVMSFSYKNGIPDDFSGNGGGFVFDCRALHNPGRYDEYKQLTGRDAAVIEFLESKSDISQFLVEAESMVDRSVQIYLSRGFTDLMVCFGCTGGRHRSLYCADRLAKHLVEKYGVKVKLIHREQSIEEDL